jgi:ankyrin repeat protein
MEHEYTFYFIREGHLKMFQLLLADHRVDPAACDDYAVRMASENGHFEVVQLLLADGRVDAGNNIALRKASENGHLQVVNLLLADGGVEYSRAGGQF